MKLVLNLFKKHQIPVFFSTVGVNLKDLKPFKSISSDEHSADEYYQLAQEQLQAQDSIAHTHPSVGHETWTPLDLEHPKRSMRSSEN